MNLAYPLILGSKSPRRREIMEKAGFQFEATSLDTDESYDPDMDKRKVAAYLAEIKAAAFHATGKYENKLILTADTTVLINGKLLEKPADKEESFEMLKQLSGQTHEVISAFTLMLNGEKETFSDSTKVSFSEASEKEILNYIDQHQPFDKAGSYGIQEGIGLTHIHRLEGSYFTVMGLPIHKVYQALKKYQA